MRAKRLLIGFGAVVVTVVLGGLPMHYVSPSGTASRPNIILITVDALRADHLGTYGYARPTSPAIDQFAREAIVVSDAISQAPYTKASIASLMTGLLPSTHKTYSTSGPLPVLMTGHAGPDPLATTDVLPSTIPILPDVLRRAGYETFAFTTNPFLIRDFGFARGFDHFRFYDGDDFAKADRVLPDAWSAITTPRSKPFFVWVHLMETHSPYDPSARARAALPPLDPPVVIPPSVNVPEWLIKQPTRNLRVYQALYDGEIRTADDAIGEFLGKMRGAGLWDRTVIVLTADHGEEFMEHGGMEHNRTLYDEVVHVPLIVRIPGLAPRRLAAQVEIVDLFPTLTAIAGAPQPGNIAGSDLSPVLAGRQQPDKFAVSENIGQAIALRTAGWKLIEYKDGRRELFRLSEDRGERHDVSATELKQVAAMSEPLRNIGAQASAAGEKIAREHTEIASSILDRLRSLGYAR